MKHTIIATVTALSLIVGLAGTATATTISFPPDFSTTDAGTSTSDGGKARTKSR